MSLEDDRLRIRLAEIMSSAGVGRNQIALEILYLLPSEFVAQYERLFREAYGEPGSGDKRGRQMDSTAELGKAEVSGKWKGQVPGAGAGGLAKRFTRVMGIKNEAAVHAKSRVDKKLRAISREIRWGLDSGFELGSGPDKGQYRCGKCGQIGERNWRFCPRDGHEMILMD